jgi:uncharacterized membrane protein YhaH (DUF805 family)
MEKKEKSEIIDKYRERFIRWQLLTQTQLSNTNNLILGLTVGFLAFSVSKTDLKFPKDCLLLIFFILSYLLLLISILTGLLLTYSRLYDFRKTKEIIKKKRRRFENDENERENLTFEISMLTKETKSLGRITWCLLHWQLLTFLIGSTLNLIVILIQNN